MSPERIVPISVGFCFDQEPLDQQEERVGNAIKLIKDNNGKCQVESEVLENGVKQVKITTELPESTIYRHHNFDSVLNKSYPEGCGAAWVEERNPLKDPNLHS